MWVYLSLVGIVTLTDFLRQCGELVDVLACVLAAGHAEAKLKIKTLQQLIAEVVSLNHAEVVDGCVAHCELHSAKITGRSFINQPATPTLGILFS